MEERRVLTSSVELDDFTAKVSKVFDYEFDGTSTFEVPCFNMASLPEDYNIGLIVGSSGSGKSTLLRDFGEPKSWAWDNTKCIASNFKNPDDAIDRLTAVGLNSIPSWVKPYSVLSNGERFRADLAIRIEDGAVVDEFTSVVDRNVAKSCSVSISKYIKKNDIKKVVFASCHKDIIEWLSPDWVLDLDTEQLVMRGCLRRPEIKLQIYETNHRAWELFKRHHYLSNKLNLASRCFVAMWSDNPVAFSANLSLPSRIPPLYEGDTRNKFRESRLVTFPDYQGMGIGTRFSDAIGEHFLNLGYRYFSKTAHIRMGEYRQNSDLWRATATNLKSREKSQKCSKKEAWHHLLLDTIRICYSHEFIGPRGNEYRELYEKEKERQAQLKEERRKKCQ